MTLCSEGIRCCYPSRRVWESGVTAFTDYLIRGQNMYAKPRTEMPMKRYGQKTNAQCRCLRRLGLEFGGVPTAVTRIGTIVYAESGNHAIRPIRGNNGWLPAPVAHFGASGLIAWCYSWLVSVPTTFWLGRKRNWSLVQQMVGLFGGQLWSQTLIATSAGYVAEPLF